MYIKISERGKAHIFINDNIIAKLPKKCLIPENDGELTVYIKRSF
jgi:hypothetical protein